MAIMPAECTGSVSPRSESPGRGSPEEGRPMCVPLRHFGRQDGAVAIILWEPDVSSDKLRAGVKDAHHDAAVAAE